MVDLLALTGRQAGVGLLDFGELPGVRQPQIQIAGGVEVELGVVAPAPRLPEVLRFTAGVVEPTPHLVRGHLLPVGDAAVDPVRRAELDAGFPAIVDRRREIAGAWRHLVGGRAGADLEGPAPVAIQAQLLNGGVDQADLRLLDAAVVVDRVIVAAQLIGEVALDAVDAKRRDDLQRLDRLDHRLQVGAVAVVVEALVAGLGHGMALDGGVALAAVALLLGVEPAFDGQVMQPGHVRAIGQRGARAVVLFLAGTPLLWRRLRETHPAVVVQGVEPDLGRPAEIAGHLAVQMQAELVHASLTHVAG